jgi:hypothetical protein
VARIGRGVRLRLFGFRFGLRFRCGKRTGLGQGKRRFRPRHRVGGKRLGHANGNLFPRLEILGCREHTRIKEGGSYKR